MRKVKKIIAGVMSALMLLVNCPLDELTVNAAEPERPSATETDATETVTIYKGDAYAYGGKTSNWFSTDEAPDSTNVNAYSVVSEYEMSENSITAEPVAVMDENLVKAVYYSYGAPGYQNMQTIMEETFLSCHAVTEEERAGISHLLISGYAEETYHCDSSRELTEEEAWAVESLKKCIDNLPKPSENFQVCLLSDEMTENEYDLIFWKMKEAGGVTEAILQEAENMEAQLQTYAAGEIQANSYWQRMKDYIKKNKMIISGADGYGIGGYNATDNWSCAGWTSNVIYNVLEEKGLADPSINTATVGDLQDKFLEVNDRFERIYNMAGNTSGTGCTSYDTIDGAKSATEGNIAIAVVNAENTFVALVNSGDIKAGDIIIFYGSGNRTHAAIMGDTRTNDMPNICNALNETRGSMDNTPVSWLFTQSGGGDKSASGFAIYRYKEYGSMSLTKESGEPDVTENDNHKQYYNLAGAVYEVTDGDGNVVGLFKTDSEGKGTVVDSAEDAEGNTVTASLIRPEDKDGETLTLLPGTYTVSEIKAPDDGSYQISYESQFVTITYDSNEKVNEPDYIETARVLVTKESSNPDMTRDNGCYSLKGAEYTIYEADGVTVASYITEKSSSGKITGWEKAENLKTNADGELPVLELPFGTYYVKETKASKGYKLDTCNEGTMPKMHDVTLEEPDKTYPVTCKEVPVDDPINILLVKWDEETNRKSPLGGASLENALFEVKYYDGYYTDMDKLPERATRTWVIQTLYDSEYKAYMAMLDDAHKVSGDIFYYDNGVVILPLGTVTVEEIQAPEGYKLLTDGGALRDVNGIVDSGIFIGQVRENEAAIEGASLYVGDKLQGTIVTGNPLTTTAISVYESIVRTDLAFTKLDYETRKEMAGIPFKITAKKTGESHIVVTDSAGYYSSNSSHMKHTENTNGNDKYLTQNLESYDDCVETGIWFYGTADQSKWDSSLIDDKKFALPYDTYIIEELPCEKNRGRQLELAVETFIMPEDDGKIKNIGIITDIMEPQITTYARDTETGSHLSSADADVTIVDTISYQWLTAGKTYTVKGILMDKGTSEDEKSAKPLLDNNGNPIMSYTTFEVDSKVVTNEKEKCGTVDVTYHFDGRNLAGETYVIFAYLFEGNNTVPLYENGALNLTGAVTLRDGEVVRHTDLSDINQTGTFPNIDTVAWEQETGTNVSRAKENVIIHDKVSFTGLMPTYEYRLESTLMDRDSGEVLRDENGEPITEINYFVATEEEEEKEITFKPIDATGMEGKATVVYEQLYWNNRNLASHTNLNDPKQTVFYPDVHTQAKDTETDEDRACADDSVTIVDTVLYENVMPGYEYELRGELINQRTGEPVTTSKGEKITAETTFIPEDFEGSIDMEFTFDAIDAGLEGEVTVCYETLLLNNIEVADHRDKNDKGQTIYFPSLKTSLRDADTGIQNTFLDEKIVLVDTVSYTNLVTGKTYRLEGILMNKATGKPVTVNGEMVTAETTFTTEKANGTAEVTFTFDGTAAGLQKENALVAFEILYYEKQTEGEKTDIIIGIHEDINDVEQTVTIPDIATTLVGKETEDHMANAGEKTTIVDHVAYSGLVPGKKYTMTGTLMTENEAGQAVPLMVNGKEISVSKTFVPNKADGIVDIEFTLDTSALAGTHVVAYEECTYEGKKVAVHADIEDEDQRVDFPKIHTNALDSETREHMANADEKVTLTDTVSYENLLADRIYTVKGTLMNKKTGEPVKDAEGKTVMAETTFNTGMPAVGSAISVDENGNVTETEIGGTKRKTVSGSVTVTFTFDASACELEGTETVVFEELYCRGGLVAEHKDLNDEGQTITFGKIRTKAKDKQTGMHTSAGGTVTIIDTVTYSGLLAGKSYKLQGVLMDKATGKPLLVNGKELCVERSFTAEKSDGEIVLSFTLDASALKGTSVVVFETVYYNGKEVAVHADINDHDQSVYFPEIGTTARDKADGDKKLATEGTVTVADIVRFTNLAPGESYVVKGVLMDKSTGKPLLVNGQEIRAEKEFTPETSDGSIEMEFTFATNGLKGKELVVFESLYLNATGELVADHADLNDGDQTVSVTAERHPHTGDESPVMVIIVIAALSLLAGCGVFFVGRRKRRNQ